MFSFPNRTLPTLMAKVELMSLGENSGEEEKKGGILQHMLGIGTNVQAGDPIAMIKVTPGKEGKENQTVTVYAPQAGTITKFHTPLQSTVAIGDALLELSDDIEKDKKAWQEHMKENKGEVQPEFWNSYLELDDVFRLQQLVILLRDRFPQIYPKALGLYQRILELQETKYEEQAVTRTDLGVLLFNLGDIEGSILQLQAALDLRKQIYGDDHPHVAASHIHLGAVHKQNGSMDKSLENMKRALEIQTKQLGEEHPVVASSYNNVGAIYYQMQDFSSAIEHYLKALRIQQKVHGEENAHVDTAGTYHNLAVAVKHTEDFKGAIEWGRKALAMRIELLQLERGESAQRLQLEQDIAASHYALGQLWSETGELEGALEQFRAALEIQERIYGKDSPITATGYNNIGAVYYQQRKFDDALTEYRKGLGVLQKSRPNHPDVAGALNNVGLALLQKGELEESLESFTSARTILENAFGKEHPNLATTIGSIGNVLKSQGKLDEALVEYKLAHRLLESALGPDHPDVASSYNNMGLVLSQKGEYDDALAAYRAAQGAFSKSLGPEHPHTGSCHFNVGLVLKSKGDSPEARKEFDQAREIWFASLGHDHPHTEMATKSMQECE